MRVFLLVCLVAGCGAKSGLEGLQATGSAARAPLSIVAITVGERHACALRENGEALCWGHNDKGQLGDDTFAERVLPAKVVGLSSAVSIHAGRNHTCARISDGSVRCWGHRALGQLGDGAALHMTTTFMVPTPVSVANVQEARFVATGDSHTCAITSGGTLCFGSNDFGELGNGRTERTSVATPVLELIGPTQIALGAAHGCAVQEGGTLKCWGSNEAGQLAGVPRERCGSYDCARRAIETSFSGVAEVAAAGNRTCVRLVDRTVSCIGALSTGTSYSPVHVPLAEVEELALGASLSCARTSDGAVWCWGREPTRVSLVRAAKRIAAGGDSACALLVDGAVWCWGRNQHGQLGDGTTIDAEVPVRIRGEGSAAR